MDQSSSAALALQQNTAAQSHQVSLVEHQHLTEMHENLKRKLVEAQKQDTNGRTQNGLRAAILAMVVGEEYEKARGDLRNYVATRNAYPHFQERAERYVSHGCDLVQAIETKRSFPGLASLSLAKQQEIHEKVLEHFEELKQNLKQIERVEREQRLNDVRSTVWVLRAASQTTLAVLAVMFFVDMRDGVLATLIRVIDVYVNDATIWILSHIKL